MFERYTEKARRVIFFARYEASQLGSHAIEAEHLLLGLLRDGAPLFQKLFPDAPASMAAIRKAVESGMEAGDRLPTSVDLPLSQNAKRVLSFAANESERLQHRHIGTEHLLLGLLREEQSLANQVLADHGVRLNKIRAAYSNAAVSSADSPPSQSTEALNLALIGPFRALLEVLTERGVLKAEESAAVLNWRPLHVSVYGLLDLLVNKGVITEAERQGILNAGR